MKKYIRANRVSNRLYAWQDYLPADVYERLGDCCNRKADIPILVDARWKGMKDEGKDKEGFTKEDALVDILEWLDSNGQWRLSDVTVDEYEELKKDTVSSASEDDHQPDTEFSEEQKQYVYRCVAESPQMPDEDAGEEAWSEFWRDDKEYQIWCFADAVEDGIFYTDQEAEFNQLWDKAVTDMAMPYA